MIYKISRIFIYMILFFVIFIYATPFFIILTTSFKTNTQAMSGTFSWIPNPIILDQYKYTLNHYPYTRWLINSVIVTIGTVFLVLIVSLPAGFAFARLKFKGKEAIFTVLMLTIMIPFAAYLPELYLEMSSLKLINTYTGLIIPFATSGVSIFLFRQFISQLPNELDDAARIDGCNNFQIFSKIILPLTKPAVISVVIFTAVKSWNALMWPLIAASNDKVKTLPVGLAVNIFQATNPGSNNPTPYGIVMAATILSILLPVLLFLFLQRYFVQGIATTGLK
ncbi:TPA: carbohydrate ABC transporter permease [Candidatus Poribacteria bacterium]|nr:carbohydrate ABC transporter permease [Candidatus Poribacteria bacterium]